MCLVCLVLCSDAGQALDSPAAESVAGALEGQDVGVVDDPVDHGGATTWSPKTPAQPENGRLLVRTSEACS